MSLQCIIGLILLSIGAIISAIGFFVISPANDFVTAVLVTSLGFILIFIGGGILKTRMGKWVRQ